MKRFLIVLTIYIVFVLAFTTGSGLALAGTSSFFKGSSSVVSSISANNQGLQADASILNSDLYYPGCPCHE
jgi:hypothetical protein